MFDIKHNFEKTKTTMTAKHTELQIKSKNFFLIKPELSNSLKNMKKRKSLLGTSFIVETKDETDLIINNFCKNVKLLLIIQQLESNIVSSNTKLEVINKLDRKDNGFTPQILSGGLYKDWDFHF